MLGAEKGPNLRAAFAVPRVRRVAVKQHSSAGLNGLCLAALCYGAPTAPLIKPLPKRCHNPVT